MKHILTIVLCMFMATNVGAMDLMPSAYPTKFTSLLKTGAKYGVVTGTVAGGLLCAYNGLPDLVKLANSASVDNTSTAMIKAIVLPFVLSTLTGSLVGSALGAIGGFSISSGCYAGQKAALLLAHTNPKAIAIGKVIGGSVVAILLGSRWH